VLTCVSNALVQQRKVTFYSRDLFIKFVPLLEQTAIVSVNITTDVFFVSYELNFEISFT